MAESIFGGVPDNTPYIPVSSTSYFTDTQSITLSKSSWSAQNGGEYYTNTVTGLGYVSTDTPVICVGIPSTLAVANLSDYNSDASGIYKVESGSGSLTAYSTKNITGYDILLLAKGH